MKTFQDPAGPIQLAAGEAFAIALPANPTTGYSWRATFDGKLLALEGQEFAPAGSGVGRGGQEVFAFRTLASGHTRIDFEYRRPWEERTHDTRRIEIVAGP